MDEYRDPFPDCRPECTICLQTILLNGYALMTCSHVFHPECIATWFRKTENTCPVCRVSVNSEVLIDLGVTPAVAAAATVVPEPFPPFSDILQCDVIPLSSSPPSMPASLQPQRSTRPSSSQFRPNSPNFVPSSRHSLEFERGMTLNRITGNAAPMGEFNFTICSFTTSSMPPPCRHNLKRSSSPSYVPNKQRPVAFQKKSSNRKSPAMERPSTLSSPEALSATETFINSMMRDDDFNPDTPSTSDDNREEFSSFGKPAYYRRSILFFLKNLQLTESERTKIILFKQRFGKYQVCEVINRAKIFLALDEDFKISSIDNLFHECEGEKKSAKMFEEIYVTYLSENPSIQNYVTRNLNKPAPRGTAYDFFNLPKPSARNPSSILFEKSFKKCVYETYGVVLPGCRITRLHTFFKNNPTNIHNVLKMAQLLHQEKSIQLQIIDMEFRRIGCCGKYK